jgi:pimeloyl-ACP methyl ester carboxylesterase
MKKYLLIILLNILLMPTSSPAQTMVLIHGFLGNAKSWHSTKTTLPLHQAGWINGGAYYNANNRIIPPMHTVSTHYNAYYTVDLPDKAGIPTQANWLNQYLQHLYQQRKEPIILVGHSAGGIVARHWLVTQNNVPVSALVTIASPHLGTPHAKYANMALDMVPDDFYEGVNITSPNRLLQNLKPESNNRYLSWLNHQPHPNISYLSIIRRNSKSHMKSYLKRNFDLFVPPYSQDMNRVYALRHRSLVSIGNQDHFLNPSDGYLIAGFVQGLN